ncbi:MAG: helix-turn-helix domain-containing protein [Treponema sp.]|nr:helix-turn-helix domain-containing protein [Treponema sp.]
MTFQEVFISNLRNLRRDRKISQLKFAEMCDSSQGYIAAIEVGKRFPSPVMIERMAAALDIESYYLFQSRVEEAQALTPLQRERLLSRIGDLIDRELASMRWKP